MQCLPQNCVVQNFFQLRPSICGHLQYKWHTGFPVQPLAEQRRHQKRSARAHTDRRRQYQRQQKTVFAPQQNRSHRQEHREPSVARHHRVRADRRQLLRPRRHDPAPRYPNCIASETHTHRQCLAAGGAAAGENVVSQEGCTRQISGVLQDRKQEKEDRRRRQHHSGDARRRCIDTADQRIRKPVRPARTGLKQNPLQPVKTALQPDGENVASLQRQPEQHGQQNHKYGCTGIFPRQEPVYPNTALCPAAVS